MRNCDICGTPNFKENKYCIHCGNEMILEHFCPVCGRLNTDSAKVCVGCGSQINPLAIDDFETLLSQLNRDLLSNAEITDVEYNQIISDIFMKADYVDIHGNTIRDKILNFAGIFTECKTKSRGYERGFIFLGNNIYYDDRLDDSIQIETIIHELGHFFLFRIIESLLCHIFNVETSATLQSFVWYFLILPEFRIMSEYCAHTVEGRFIPYGYQNYGSFNALVEGTGVDEESLSSMVKLGNSFANEIIVYLEKYIGDELRDEIKLQYRRDSNPQTYDSILRETDICFELGFKNSILLRMLGEVLQEVSSNSDEINELENIKEGIELS